MHQVGVLFRAANRKCPISIEVLEVDPDMERKYSRTRKESLTTVNEMHLDTNAISVQRAQGSQIAVLVGSDYYWELVTGTVKPVHGKLKAVETRLGWTVPAPLPAAADIIQCASAVVLRSSVEDGVVSKLFPHFWDVESIGVKTQEGRVTGSDSVLLNCEQNTTKKGKWTSPQLHHLLPYLDLWKMTRAPFGATSESCPHDGYHEAPLSTHRKPLPKGRPTTATLHVYKRSAHRRRH